MKPATLVIPPRYKEQLRKTLTKIYGPYCPIAKIHGEKIACEDLHHSKMINNKTNRLLYPDVIHSIFNLKYVSHRYHMQFGRWGQLKGYLWAERLQKFLGNPKHKLIRDWANGVTASWMK